MPLDVFTNTVPSSPITGDVQSAPPILYFMMLSKSVFEIELQEPRCLDGAKMSLNPKF
jgi:hypothetical protein